MSTFPVKLLLNGEQNVLPSASWKDEDVLCKFSIQKDDRLRMFLQVECSSVEPHKYWEYDLGLDILELSNDGEGWLPRNKVKIPTFSNYTTTANILMLEENVDGLAMYPFCRGIRIFELTKESLFDKPIKNITDCKLIVEGQTLYVCKKLLANFSSFFYELFYNNNECNQNEHVISEPCNSFRVFLGCLYGQYSLMRAYPQIIRALATCYEAWRCSEECETYLFQTGMSREQKLHFAWPMKSKRFTERIPNLTDVVLSVGDKKFRVSKQILAYLSSYFYTMFYSDFVEKGRDEIELKEIDANEFEMFLYLVYHENRLFKIENVKAQLKLAQMYDAPLVIQKCIASLQDEISGNNVLKIKMSLDFNIPEILDNVISELELHDLHSLHREDGFDELDNDIIGQITRRVLDKTRVSN